MIFVSSKSLDLVSFLALMHKRFWIITLIMIGITLSSTERTMFEATHKLLFEYLEEISNKFLLT